MTTKVPLSMLQTKVVTAISSQGAGLSVVFSDGSTSAIGSVGGGTGSTGAASVFTPRPASGMKAGDIATEGGIIYMYDGTAWRQIFPAVYS